jgi:hypothetical protein
MNWLALDIGGANLKLADGKRYVEAHAFPLWRESERLAQQLRMLIAQAPTSDHLAVTMTGELADCFENKSAGVRFILNAVREASDGRHTRVYLTDGRLVAPQIAEREPMLAAAANWHALARFVGRIADKGPAVLIDIGSTTCDMIPLMDGQPVAVGKTDTQRLLNSELIYTGVERSPVCSLIDSTPYRGQQCPVVQEVFATTGDVYVILGELPEGPTRTNTADGRPATKRAARARLGRMICADENNFNHKDAVAIAQAVAESQTFLIGTALKRLIGEMPAPPESIIVSGHGEFLARRVIENLSLSATVVALSKLLGATVSRCATAHALAVLASESV